MPAEQPFLSENEISSGDQNNSDVEAYLPWERLQGFLWGLPATWWLIITRPFQAFAAPAKAGWPRALGYALAIYPVTYLGFFLILLNIVDWVQRPRWDQYTTQMFHQIVLGWPVKELIAVLIFTVLPVWLLHRAFADKPHRATRVLRYCLYLESFNLSILISGLITAIFMVYSLPFDILAWLARTLWLAFAMSADKSISRSKAVLIAFVVIPIRAVVTWYMYTM